MSIVPNAPSLASAEIADRYAVVGTDIRDRHTGEVAQWDSGDVHPEIPHAHWVEERYLDDDEGRIVKDESTMEYEKFGIQLNRVHAITDAGYATSDDHVDVFWRSVWSDGSGADDEFFTVLLDDAPALIAALERAVQAMSPAKVLRRSPEVDDHLRNLDDWGVAMMAARA